ncbi:hypothetical protein L596_005483 [Steinernema carpocapsae]|uniref:Uncharacterized protein n=1 Tax=Steinernema carpocapsae TaxID=34508 RepID=A0A4U8V3Z7_STECR|nr:hypothetical protein L596_005483 [Steinernema carpocapsae]
MAYGIRMEAGLCPAGRVLRRKQGPKVIKGDNNELTKAKVLLSMAAEKLEEVTALTDVPENVTKIIKEALSILDTPQRNQPNVIEQSKLKVRTNEPAEKPPAPKEVDRVIPDYQVFVGVNDDDNFKPQATDYDEFDFELVKKNHALMDELAAALAVPAQTHKERERQACLGEEEEEEVEAESSENEESEVEEFRHSVFSPPNLAQELNSVFVGAPRFGGASLLKDILASSAMVRNQQQEDTFGDSDDSDDDGN